MEECGPRILNTGFVQRDGRDGARRGFTSTSKYLLLGALLLDLGDRLRNGLVVTEERHRTAVAGLPVARLDRLEIRQRELVPGSQFTV